MSNEKKQSPTALWIEIPGGLSKFPEKREDQVAKLNRVIWKLGIPNNCKFELNGDKKDELIYVHPDGTFWDCPENGHRFSLDYLAQ